MMLLVMCLGPGSGHLLAELTHIFLGFSEAPQCTPGFPEASGNRNGFSSSIFLLLKCFRIECPSCIVHIRGSKKRLTVCPHEGTYIYDCIRCATFNGGNILYRLMATYSAMANRAIYRIVFLVAFPLNIEFFHLLIHTLVLSPQEITFVFSFIHQQEFFQMLR